MKAKTKLDKSDNCTYSFEKRWWKKLLDTRINYKQPR